MPGLIELQFEEPDRFLCSKATLLKIFYAFDLEI